ncbi:MAG: hypothetical protein R6V51_00025 [Dehalococcoidia bacterium]
MNEDFKATLMVNNEPIELNPFTEQFLARTVLGAVSSLRGAEDVHKLEMHLERGDVEIYVNGSQLPVTPFPGDIMTNTIKGLVSTLKGVGEIESVHVEVKA